MAHLNHGTITILWVNRVPCFFLSRITSRRFSFSLYSILKSAKFRKSTFANFSILLIIKLSMKISNLISGQHTEAYVGSSKTSLIEHFCKVS